MRKRVRTLLLLLVAMAAATTAFEWNAARIAPPPVPSGSMVVERRTVSWAHSTGVVRADVYVPAGLAQVPIVLFSPGFGVAVSHYGTILTDIASHGYLVVAIPHPPIANPDRARLIDVAPLAARTLVRALDAIASAGRGNDSIFLRADTTRVAAIGHSIGGAGAAQACMDDHRIRAVINFDGSMYGRVVHQGVPCPLLLIERALELSDALGKSPRFYEDRNQGVLHEDSVRSHSRDMTWLTVDRLDHMSFTDEALAFRTGTWFREASGLQLSARRVQRISVSLAVDFLQTKLSAPPGASPAGRAQPKGVRLVVR